MSNYSSKAQGQIVLDFLAQVNSKKSKEVQEIPEILNCIRSLGFHFFFM